MSSKSDSNSRRRQQRDPTRREFTKGAGAMAGGWVVLDHSSDHEESFWDFLPFVGDDEEIETGKFWNEENGVLIPADGQPLHIQSGEIESTTTKVLANVEVYASEQDGDTGGEKIANAVDKISEMGVPAELVVNGEGPDTDGRWSVDNQSAPLLNPTPSNLSKVDFRGRPTLYLADGTDEDVLQPKDASDITIEGAVEIDGNKANNTSSGGTNLGNAGVRPLSCDGVTIRDVEAHSFSRYGIESKYSTDVVMERCEGRNCDDDGISITDTNSGGSTTRMVELIDCRGINNANSGIEVDDGPVGVTITNPKTKGNNNGVTIHQHAGEISPRSVTVESPTSIDEKKAVYIKNVEDDGVGDPLQYTIDTPQAEGCTTNAIEVRGEAAPVNGISILNPQITMGAGASNGIYVVGPWDDITITNPQLSGAGDDESGIRFVSNDSEPGPAEVEGGHIHGFGACGVRIQALTPDISDMQIRGVSCYNNGQRTSLGNNRRSGITVGSSDTGVLEDVQVTDCRCYDDQATKTQQYGIYHSDEDYGMYAQNNIRGNANAGFGGTAGTNTQKSTNQT